ncbi:MAG: response regulator transcription factor [Myxococcales bacterium]|nr:response regulator transcription factor [Myxococcales bacterium]
MKILLVEDEAHIAKALVVNFQAQGYEVEWAATGEEALAAWRSTPCQLIVLDVMLPGIDGFEVARRVRREDANVPILMLTALAADEDRIAGLECGVDDYLVKPFVLKELLLRVAALLRRAQWMPPPATVFSFGQAEIHPATLEAVVRGKTHVLTRIECDLMRHFAAHPDRLISREELLSSVWGYEADTATRTVDTFVMRVRKIVEPEPAKPRYLRSVRGQGYRYHPAGK